MLNSLNISSIEGINSFTNLTKFEHSSNSFSTVGLINADMTGLNQLIHLEIKCGNLNLGQKENLEILIIPSTDVLVYNSNSATIKKFRGKLPAFTSIDYLKRLNLESITFTYLNYAGALVPYEVLKYHFNLNSLVLLYGNVEANNEFGNIDFTTYNPLDNPTYPQNIKKLAVHNLTQFFPLQNFQNLEDLSFYSVGVSDCANCLIYNQTYFPNLKYLSFYRKNSNPISNLDLSELTV